MAHTSANDQQLHVYSLINTSHLNMSDFILEGPRIIQNLYFLCNPADKTTNQQISQPSKNWHFGMVGRVDCHPKTSAVEDWDSKISFSYK